ncbi:MAG TPA: glycosyltransferase family 9 protein [Abditibacteriaceae bacterium]|nr:glycosyltransferase family 9 protein [Abditibacteriaceae bacterium]
MIQRVAAVPDAAAVSAALAASVDFAAPVRHIVTIHLGGLSDFLFTLPALLALRETFEGALIYALVRPELATLLEGSPLVDEILLRPRGGLSAQAALMVRLRAHHMDIAVAFSPSRNATLLAWSSGASVRIGFTSAHMEPLLTHGVLQKGPATVETYLDLVRALGCQTRQHDYCGLLRIAPRYRQQADNLLARHGITAPFLVAAPEAGGKRSIKEWPAAYWAAALDELAVSYPIVLAGTRPATAITGLLQARDRVFDCTGRTDLPTLAALCGRARWFIGIDSGPLHLAAAMGIPTVGIFGPSDWCLTGPRGVPHRIARHPVECSPCMLPRCKWTGADERKCLTLLTPNQVVRAARELVGL